MGNYADSIHVFVYTIWYLFLEDMLIRDRNLPDICMQTKQLCQCSINCKYLVVAQKRYKRNYRVISKEYVFCG